MKIKIGKTIDNKEVNIDFLENPHILIAGSTGSGKSVMMNAIITNIIEQSNSLMDSRLILIDPKRVEFADYESCFLLHNNKVYTNVTESIAVLEEVIEMIHYRYFLLKQQKCKNIEKLHQKGIAMERVYICIDELSFLMLQDKKKVEKLISEIGMIGRACGVHLILATQRPDRATITGSILANIDCVIGLRVRTSIESRMILQDNSLTELKGKGDAIIQQGFERTHFQGIYRSDEEVEKAVNECNKRVKHRRFNLIG